MTEVLVSVYFVVVLFQAGHYPPRESYRARVDGPQECGTVIGLLAEDLQIEGKIPVRWTAACVVERRSIQQEPI